MLHVIIAAVLAAGAFYVVANLIVLAGRVVWLALLVAAWCFMAVWTALLAVALGCQRLIEAVANWRWRRRYGEILPPPE
jgi:hypothetical protein